MVTAIGNASQNRLWFFDGLSQQIGLFNYETRTYVFLTQPQTGPLLYYETDFNTFQWIGSDHKRYAVDVYGKVSDLGNVPPFDAMRFISESESVFINDGEIHFSNRLGESKKLIDIDPKSFQSFWYKDQILTIFTPDAITNYKIIRP